MYVNTLEELDKISQKRMILEAQQEYEWDTQKMVELAEAEARARAKADEWLQAQVGEKKPMAEKKAMDKKKSAEKKNEQVFIEPSTQDGWNKFKGVIQVGLLMVTLIAPVITEWKKKKERMG